MGLGRVQLSIATLTLGCCCPGAVLPRAVELWMGVAPELSLLVASVQTAQVAGWFVCWLNKCLFTFWRQ